MNPTTWTCFDFGSAYIRVTRAAAGQNPATITPLLVQFDGQPALRNVAYLAADGRLRAVGDDVLRLDPTELDILRLRWGTTLLADPESDPGEAAGLLLAHIVAILEQDHRFTRDEPGAVALIGLPIVAEAGAGPTLTSRLQAAGFAAVTSEDSALAALAYYSGGRPAPGRYGVIDCGAARTRLAIVDCRADEPPVVVAREHARPGGGDFDEALLAYFARQLPPLTSDVEALAQRAAIEGFKRRFAEAWADGRPAYSAVETFGSTRVTLALDSDTFLTRAVAGPLVNDFRMAADAFFERHDPDKELNALLLVGGGARWPFVRQWATGRFDQDDVRSDLYPERVVVLGLPRLAAWRAALLAGAPQAGPPDRVAGGAGRVAPPPARSKPSYPAAGPAALIEFLAGLVGVLGLGWFLSVRHVALSCLCLLGWWATLLLLLTLGVVSAVGNRPELIIPLLILWLGVPALSSGLLYRRLRRARAG